MTKQFLNLASLALCAALLTGAQRHSVEYRVWAGSPPDVVNGPGDATYVFDAGWRQRWISSDQWRLARASPARLRLRAKSGRWWYSVGGKFFPSECNAGPFESIMSPSGVLYACVADNFPDTTLHVFRTSDRHPVATIRLPQAYIEGRDAIAFVNDDRVLFANIDHSCPRERRSRLRRSIAEISIGGRFTLRTFFPCASGVIVGNRRIAFLREHSTEYSLDGGGWVTEPMYAFDQDDNPITESSPGISRFKSSHPDLAVWLVSVGPASGEER